MNMFRLPLASTAAPLGALLVALLTGCLDGGSKPAGEPEVLKQLSPLVTDVIQESRAVENYVSYDPERGTYYRAIPGFVWQAALTTARHGYADPADYEYAGFAMQVETDDNKPDLGQICSSSVRIALYPPAATLTASGAQFDPESGMGNEALSRGDGECGNDYFRLRGLDDDSDGMWDRFRYSFPPGNDSTALLSSAVAGSWQLRDGSGVLASFELPELDPDSAAQVLLPVPRLNYDPATGLIEGIDIQWYARGNLEPVAKSSAISRSMVVVLDQSTDMEIREQYAAYGLAKQAVFPRYPWRLKDHEQTAAEDPRITAMQISYEIEGVAYRFIWQ